MFRSSTYTNPSFAVYIWQCVLEISGFDSTNFDFLGFLPITSGFEERGIFSPSNSPPITKSEICPLDGFGKGFLPEAFFGILLQSEVVFQR